MKEDFLCNKEVLVDKDKNRLITLQKRSIEEFSFLGIDSNLCKLKESIYIRNSEGTLNTAGYKIQVELKLNNGLYSMEADMKYQFHWMDGSGRDWDTMTYVIPYSFFRNDDEIIIPSEVKVLGYQVAQKDYLKKDKIPSVRIDSVCIPSMLMGGHRATEKDESLGCDCAFQRESGQEYIYKNGGISIISPFEGRGNGLVIHAGQLMLQWTAKHYGEKIPDTYEAVESLGALKDSRTPFYPLDMLIFKMFGQPKKINLLTNNPEKIRSFRTLGIDVNSSPHHAQESTEYYNGSNFQAKVKNGHSRNKVIYSSSKS